MSCLFVLALLVPSPVHALLIDNLDGTVTDTDLNLMWLKTPGPDASWANAVAWADALVFAGHDDWRLPSALTFGTGTPDETWFSTQNEFGHLYGTELHNPADAGDILPLIGYQPIWFWTGTPDGNDAYAFFWSFDGLWLNESSADRADMTADSRLHVTAVRSVGGDIVPEPSTLGLLGAGLVALKRFARRGKKG